MAHLEQTSSTIVGSNESIQSAISEATASTAPATEKLDEDIKHTKPEQIDSGESKFKYYSFEPGSVPRGGSEIQKCIDFWKFIEAHNDLFPQRGWNMSKQVDCKAKKEEDEKLTWDAVLNLLKAKQLDKVAKQTKIKSKGCEVETCAEKSRNKTRKSDSDDEMDDFTLADLDEFNPQKKVFADIEIQTDEIEMTDQSTQTEFPDSGLDLRLKMEDMDQILKEVADGDLTGYFDCICDDPCEWLPYPTTSKISDASTHSTSSKANKCTCSCGENNCQCALCYDLLTLIDKARDSFEQLSSFEIEDCPCTHFTCECLNDYRVLLDVKLEITRIVRLKLDDSEARFGLPVRCQCECNQANCPCGVVMKLFQEIDELMGYKEKPLFYKEPTMGIEYEVDVCRCGDEADEMPCLCLNYFRQNIKEKIDKDKTSDKSDVTDKIFECCTASDTVESLQYNCSSISNEDKGSSESAPCLCRREEGEIGECLRNISEVDIDALLSLLHVKKCGDFPPVPPNSIQEIENNQD